MITDCSYVFVVYTETEFGLNIIGVTDSMEKAESIQGKYLEKWNLKMNCHHKKLYAIPISQIPLNYSIHTHGDYVMKVKTLDQMAQMSQIFG